MITDYEYKRIVWINRILKSVPRSSVDGRTIVEWVIRNARLFGEESKKFSRFKKKELTWKESYAEADKLRKSNLSKEEVDAGLNAIRDTRRQDRYDRINKILTALVEQYKEPTKRSRDHVSRNIEILSKAVSLTPLEQELVLFLADASHSKFLSGEDRYDRSGSGLLSDLRLEKDLDGNSDWSFWDYLSVITTESEAAIARCFDETQTLLKSGYIIDGRLGQYDDDKKSLFFVSSDSYRLSKKIRQLITREAATEDELLTTIRGRLPEGHLNIENYRYMAEEAKQEIAILYGSLQDTEVSGKSSGLIGMPGVGKTQFAWVALQELRKLDANIEIRIVGSERSAAREKKGVNTILEGDEILAEVQQALFLAERSEKPTIVWLEEIDDIAIKREQNSNRRTVSIDNLHRIIEGHRAVLAYTSNNLNFDPATIRRLLPARHMPLPPSDIRAEIIKDQAKAAGLEISQSLALELAREHSLPPAVTERVFRVMKWLKLSKYEITDPDQLIINEFQSAARAFNQGNEPLPRVAEPDLSTIDPRLFCATTDPVELIETLKLRNTNAGLGICVHGESGLGKRTFLKLLAHELGVKILFRSFGEHGSEDGALAEVFEEARLKNAMLVFDDAAIYFNQISRHPLCIRGVNHPLPFVICSNSEVVPWHPRLNEFPYHLAFDYLRPVEAMMAFHHFYQCEPPPIIQVIPELTLRTFQQIKDVVETRGLSSKSDAIAKLFLQRLTREDQKKVFRKAAPLNWDDIASIADGFPKLSRRPVPNTKRDGGSNTLKLVADN